MNWAKNAFTCPVNTLLVCMYSLYILNENRNRVNLNTRRAVVFAAMIDVEVQM